MSGISRRLGRLEDGSGSCPACGLGPASRIVYSVFWDDAPGDDPAGASSSPPCSRCGQRRLTVVDWWDARPDLAGDEGGRGG